MKPANHEFVLSRVVKLGAEAIATNKEWITTHDPDEAIAYYRRGYEFEDGLCTEYCPICADILDCLDTESETGA